MSVYREAWVCRLEKGCYAAIQSPQLPRRLYSETVVWNGRCGNGWDSFLIRRNGFLCPFLRVVLDATTSSALLALNRSHLPGKEVSASRIVQYLSDVLDILRRSPAAAPNQTRTRGAELQSRLAHLLARLVAGPRVLAGHICLAGIGIAEQR